MQRREIVFGTDANYLCVWFYLFL